MSETPDEEVPMAGAARPDAPLDPAAEAAAEARAETPAPEPAAAEPAAADGAAAPEEAGAGAEPAAAEAPAEVPATPEVPEVPEVPTQALRVVEVADLDWAALRAAVAKPFDDARSESIIGRMEDRLAGGGPLGLAFEEHAASPDDLVLHVTRDPGGELWFVGDVHGDLLALEAALQAIDRHEGGDEARIVFLGDLFDDGVRSPEVMLRLFELILERSHWRVTVVAGNHDEALRYDGVRFHSSVIPSDFADWLNAHLDHPWAARLGRRIVEFFERAPRAIFLPDGLLAAHAGVPHADLLPLLEETGDWNDPRLLQDFVWLRAHPRARRRLPNRTTRGSEFGREDFAAFCEVATRMGRPVSRMVRGHDHVEERFAVYYPDTAHPLLTVNTMSHRLPREVFGGYERAPVIARWVRGELPEVHRLMIPPELVRELNPEPGGGEEGR